MSAEPHVRTVSLDAAAGRWTLAAAVLGSGMAFLDSTTVTVALPAIGRQLGGGLALLQWVIAGYLLAFGALVLTGRALAGAIGGDRAFLIGAAAFGATSALCAAAPAAGVLVVARLLQGASASLLAPASFAVVASAFAPEDRGRAVALWAGVAGAATVAGPLVGGILVDHAGWSWVFWINVPLALAAVIAGIRFVPARQVRRKPLGESLDLGGAGTCLLGLGLLAYGVIEGPSLGFHRLRVLGSLAAGVLLLVAFTVLEARREHPMLPLQLFRIREFAVASLTTLLVYAALTAALLLAVLELQEVAGYTALGSGAALVPVTLLILLSPRIARALAWAEPRRLMVTGALLAALGALLLVRVSAGASYFGAVLPACVVLGLGLAVTVAPLTATVLGSVPSVRAGVASEVNSMVARLAGLAGVAAIPVAAGLAARPAGAAAFTSGFHRAMVVAAVLCVAAAAVALLGFRPSPGDGAAA